MHVIYCEFALRYWLVFLFFFKNAVSASSEHLTIIKLADDKNIDFGGCWGESQQPESHYSSSERWVIWKKQLEPAWERDRGNERERDRKRERACPSLLMIDFCLYPASAGLHAHRMFCIHELQHTLKMALSAATWANTYGVSHTVVYRNIRTPPYPPTPTLFHANAHSIKAGLKSFRWERDSPAKQFLLPNEATVFDWCCADMAARREQCHVSPFRQACRRAGVQACADAGTFTFTREGICGWGFVRFAQNSHAYDQSNDRSPAPWAKVHRPVFLPSRQHSDNKRVAYTDLWYVCTSCQ